ncbi:cation acetate symporter [Lapillicoccus jejuensis]|uniref:Cation/acetate symporter n=1 Tax=Lapillicoccus jejuensis TaxID=402171 RepID=A0A542DXT7_9MICO|nr:cation acetate symporter [Lapillicoccus jejuensis]TQJ07885.1 cation/acetate symporter [Lapillicoccus jejuensis]
MRSPGAVVAVTLVCLVTLAVGAFGLRLSRTTSDFYVAGRSVSARWNASAISGEYLSAASFLGVAGLVFSLGADMLWFPVGYTVGYLVLLVLVAAPLRRSGAYTLPDFAELRLQSRGIRLLASVLVVGIGWLYLLPQFQGAGLALATVTGAPPYLGNVVVALVVLASVAAGGMRSITLVQAVQYWIKLTAIAVPAFVLMLVWARNGHPLPAAEGGWEGALAGFGAREHPTYATYSTLLALCLGTMGLPHVLVRFYTNPDGPSARRTTLIVIALLGAFYVVTPVYGVLGRVYVPTLPDGLRADAVTLLVPEAVSPGTLGALLSAVLAGGAFAAFLSTASGLTVSVAGVLDQDLLGARMRRTTGGDVPPARTFRLSAVVAVAVPAVASLVGVSTSLADTVGLAFAVAASTFCPLLILGVWWRRLSVTGAAAGLLTGGTLALAATVATVAGVASGRGWAGALLAQPAAWTMPTATLVMVLVSLATPGRVPPGTARTLVRLHVPEDVLAATRGRRADADEGGALSRR